MHEVIPRGKLSLVKPSDEPTDDDLVSVRDVAGQLGVHPETVRRLIHNGSLEAVRVGRVLRVPPAALAGFLQRQRIKPPRYQA